jgi:hypothetical protein
MTLKNAINGFRIKDRYDQAFIASSTSEYYMNYWNVFKQFFKRNYVVI